MICLTRDALQFKFPGHSCFNILKKLAYNMCTDCVLFTHKFKVKLIHLIHKYACLVSSVVELSSSSDIPDCLESPMGRRFNYKLYSILGFVRL